MSTLNVTGNLAAAPELRFTPNGKAVATFTVLENRRRKSGQEWVDDTPNAFNVEVWEGLAENVAESLGKGDRVTVIGEVRTHSWKDKETGANRTRQILAAEEVAASLRFATVSVSKATRSQPGTQQDNPEQPWG